LTEGALEATARLYHAAAVELDEATQHWRSAAEHFRSGEVPRGSAHAWAALGHVLEAEESLRRQAGEHAARSVP
jgi:uncharacterized protein HemY